jgi:hypothetical protein
VFGSYRQGYLRLGQSEAQGIFKKLFPRKSQDLVKGFFDSYALRATLGIDYAMDLAGFNRNYSVQINESRNIVSVIVVSKVEQVELD